MDLTAARQEFLDFLASRNKAFLTSSTYGYSLDRFFGFLERQYSIAASDGLQALTLDHIRQYGLWLYRQQLATRTRFKYLVVIRNWIKYLASRGLTDLNPALIELPKYGRQPPQLDERLPLMLKVEPPAPDPWREIIRLRDRAIIETLFSTQLRVSEVVALNRNSIDWDKRLAVVTGKGGRTRTVFFSDSCVEAINAYLDARKDNYPPLFVHHDRAHRTAATGRGSVQGENMRLTRQGIERVVRRYAQLAGVEATPHSFRHYGATELLRNGADIRSVQELLGHASVSTTQIYTHSNPTRLHQEWQRFHPAHDADLQELIKPTETPNRKRA